MTKSLYLLLLLLPFYAVSQIDTIQKDTILSNDQYLNKEVVKTLDSLPIVLKNDTVFFLKSYYANKLKLRTSMVEARLETLAAKFDEKRDTIFYEKNGDMITVSFKDDLLFVVGNEDAINENIPVENLAIERISALNTSLHNYKYNLSSEEWLKRVGYTVLTFLGLFLIIFIINIVFKHLNNRLSKYDKKLLKRRKSIIKYLIPKNTKNIFVFLSSSSRIILLIVVLFTYLPLLFSFIPATQGWVHLFYSYIEAPVFFLIHGFVNFLPDLFFIIIIFYVTRYFVRVSHDIFDDIESEHIKFANFPKDWASPTKKILGVILYAFGLVMMFPHLPGSDSPAFKGVSLFLGVLFSLGSTSAVSNVVAGIVITYMRPFQIGDRVEIMGITGDVIDKTMLVTRLRTIKNEEITIPNSNVISNHLTNFTANSKGDGLILHTDMTLGYGVELEEATSLLIKAANMTHLVQKTPKPFVLQTSLDESYVTYELNVYTKQASKMAAIYSELNMNLLQVFNDANIEILSPKYVASRDGNMSTVPSQHGVDLRNPIDKAIDHLTGKNQKNNITKSGAKEKPVVDTKTAPPTAKAAKIKANDEDKVTKVQGKKDKEMGKA